MQRNESLIAQIRAIKEFAQKEDIKIVKVFEDEAKSATSDKRPEFQKMIKYCELETSVSIDLCSRL